MGMKVESCRQIDRQTNIYFKICPKRSSYAQFHLLLVKEGKRHVKKIHKFNLNFETTQKSKPAMKNDMTKKEMT